MSQIANIIRDQIGGKALYMLGATNLSTNGNNLAFRIKGSKKANYVNVKYDESSDLYDLEFGKIKKFDYKIVNEINGLYADQLHEIIEQETGLYTKLF